MSAILHSLAHSIHAISDITVDFSLPPNARRLRAPTGILVEQSTVLRATIPVGVQFGEMGGAQAQVLGVNIQDGSGLGGGQAGGHGGLQQAIANMLQGALFQNQQQRTANASTGTGTQTTAATANPAGRPTGVVTPTTTASRPTGSVQPVPQTPGPPSFLNHNTPAPFLLSDDDDVEDEEHVVLPVPTEPPTTAAAGAGAGAAAGQQQSLQSLMGSFQSQSHRPRDILLQCHSPHNNRAPATPPRPPGLSQFLSQESQGLSQNSVEEVDTEYLDMLVGFSQILNLIRPAIHQYIQGNMLRGRTIRNPNHILTGVRSYGRRFAEWIVVSSLNTNNSNIFSTLSQ